MKQENNDTSQSKVSYGELQQKIWENVLQNENSRKDFINNPVKAIKEKLGVTLEEDIKVNIIDFSNPKSITLVLPVNPSQKFGVEFTEEQLNTIAGGVNIVINPGGLGVHFEGDLEVEGDVTIISDVTTNVGVIQRSEKK